MKSHCRSKLVLVTLLSISLLATGCSAQWISVALADLPGVDKADVFEPMPEEVHTWTREPG
jgi:hypothetical protein